MAETVADPALRGLTVLIVHEDRFRGAYLAEVLRGAEAIVAGPVDTVSGGLALLDPVPMRGAMVLSSAVAGGEALYEVAAARGVATLLVHPARTPFQNPSAAVPYLEAPYAGFQVVEALARLLGTRAGGEVQRAGPCLRGH